MRYGGRFRFEFSSNVTSITVAPAAIYQFSEQFGAGATVSFGYADFKLDDSY
jgi:long-subunit fatty acid transport protein